MEPLPPTSRRSTRLLLVAAGVVVLLGIVAFASRSGFGHSSHAAPTNAYLSYAFTLFLILFVLMIPIAAYAWIMRVREDETPKRRHPAYQLYRSLLFIGVIVLLLYVRHYLLAPFHHLSLHSSSPAHGKGAGRPGSLTHRLNDTGPRFEWPVLWISVVALLAGGSYLYVQHRKARLRKGPLEDSTAAEDLVATISDAIDDLEHEQDPRRAVIAAYARMEGVLGRHGFRRRPSETALEYMRRVLLELTSSGSAVERLTSDFEQAKFSSHEIDAAMKADAIGALREIRDGMATA